jgi:NAD(P)-dependent dehydrogenase (short-subunit alcohol dehydrogenase family)
MRVKDRVVVVTGGASGIGAALCRRFADEEARGVVVADRNAEGAQALAREIGGLGVACDVSREADVAALARQAEAAYGPIDVFFSNAGIASGGDPLSTPLDEWQRQWEINFMAHVYAVRAVLPGMLERGSGYLLHTASMAGILTSQGNAVYASTKHAVVGFAEWLSITYHHRGIRVSCLAPLGVRTPMLGDPTTAWARTSAGPIKEPDEVADMVIAAMAEERFLIVTDPIAQEWMSRKTGDPERWLRGMRRLQVELEKERS